MNRFFASCNFSYKSATRYEDKGNRRYKEIELSLPNELSLAQNLEILDKFIADHLSSHYYAYAIHEKSGELSGESHPHVHIMFSERIIDDVEKIKERPACKYFRRAAKPLKGKQVASFLTRKSVGVYVSAKVLELCHTIKLTQILDEEIAEIEELIQNHMQEIHSSIESIPSISFRLAAVIKAEVGDFKHFFSLYKIWAFAGLSLTTYQSGKYTSSNATIKKRDAGKHYFVALSHVAKKLVRVIFHLQRTGESFSDFA